MPDDPRYPRPKQFRLPPYTSGPPAVPPAAPFSPGMSWWGPDQTLWSSPPPYPEPEIPYRHPPLPEEAAGSLLPGMRDMYALEMGAAGWELLTDDEKRAWWGEADQYSRDRLRAAIEESRVEPKKLGAPHSPGEYKSRDIVRSIEDITNPLQPGVAPIDVQRPTEKIITGPLRQAMEEEVIGTPGREPTKPPPEIAARDAELFGVGELDVAMDEAMAGGRLGERLGGQGDEFQGIYQYFKSRGVPEDKIDQFWRRTINDMGDFEGKTIWKPQAVDDLINTDTGEAVQGVKDSKGRWKIVQSEYTGAQLSEEREIKERIQELVDGGMHRQDAEVMVREKGLRRRTSEQQSFVTDDPVVMGKPWEAEPGTPAYDMVTERVAEWADEHGVHPTPTGADDPRSRVLTEHPRFTELHSKRLAKLRAAAQAEGRIGQSIALDPITGEPGFRGVKFFHAPGDFPDPTPDPFRGKPRPSGMEQLLRDINAGGVEPPNRWSLLERLSREGRGPLPDLTNLTDSQLSALSSDLSGRVPAGTATMTDAMDLHDVMEEIKRRNLIKSGEGRFTYPRPRPGIETDLRAIMDDSLDIQIAGDAAGRRSQSLPATRAMLEGNVGPGRGGARLARTPGDQPSLPGMGDEPTELAGPGELTGDVDLPAGGAGEPPTKPPPIATGGLGPGDYLYNREAQILYKEMWDIEKKGYVVSLGIDDLNRLNELRGRLKEIGVPMDAHGMPYVEWWHQNPSGGKSVLEGEPYVDTGLYMEDDPRLLGQAMEAADMPFVPRGKRTVEDYLAKTFTTDELHTFLKDLEASPSPYASWGKEEIDQYARDVRAELARRSPTELAGPGELTGGVKPPGEPPTVATGGLGPEDYLYNRNAQKLYKRYWELEHFKYVADLSDEQIVEMNAVSEQMRKELDRMGVPLEGGDPYVEWWHKNPHGGKSVLEGEPFIDTGIYLEDDFRYQAMEPYDTLTAAEDQALRLQAKEQEAIQQADWERVQVESAPPKVKVGDRWVLPGGTDDLFPNSKPLNDAVNEWIAGGMTEEGLDDLAKKANDPKSKWLKDLNDFLEDQGKPRRAKKSAAMRDIADIITGDVSLAEAATAPTPRPSPPPEGFGFEDLTVDEIDLLGRQEAERIKLDEVEGILADPDIDDIGDLARAQAGREMPLVDPVDEAEQVIRQQGIDQWPESMQQTQRGVGPGAPDVPAATTDDLKVIAEEFSILKEHGVVSEGEVAKWLEMLRNGEKEVMKEMTITQQKALLRLMGETRAGTPWADYQKRNKAYKLLLKGHDLTWSEMTRALLRANPSFRLTMGEALGIGMTKAERKAAGAGVRMFTKRMVGKTAYRGSQAASLFGKTLNPLGWAELGASVAAEASRGHLGPGQTWTGDWNIPIPLTLNMKDIEEELAQRLVEDRGIFAWTTAHVVMEKMALHGLISPEDAVSLAKDMERLEGVDPNSDRAKELVNAFNTKMRQLIHNTRYEMNRTLDVVVPTEKGFYDWVDQVPVLGWLSRQYTQAGVAGSEAPFLPANLVMNPQSLSRGVDKVRVKVTAANALRSGHIPPSMLMLVAPEVRYREQRKDEGFSMLSWRNLAPVAWGGRPTRMVDSFHEVLQAGQFEPPTDQEWTEMIRHPQGKKLAEDLASGKVIAINPKTGVPYDIGDLSRDPSHPTYFDPQMTQGFPTYRGTQKAPPDYRYLQASDFFRDNFQTMLGYRGLNPPTWKDFLDWKSLSAEEKRGSASASGTSRLADKKPLYFYLYEDVLDDMYSQGVFLNIAKRGAVPFTQFWERTDIGQTRMNLDSHLMPDPTISMYTGREVRGGELQPPRFSFENDFDDTARAWQRHIGPRELFPTSQEIPSARDAQDMADMTSNLMRSPSRRQQTVAPPVIVADR